MHADLCGNKRAGSGRGSQVETAVDFDAVGPAHHRRDLLDVHVGRQVLDFEIGLSIRKDQQNALISSN